MERRLLEVVEQVIFTEPVDWLSLLPEGIGEFTTKDLVEQLGIRKQLAQKIAYSLRKAGTIELIGKEGRVNLYEVAKDKLS